MILKDKRLLLCAELVTGDHICDIGTDHGYLPAYLVLTGKCRRATAADINEMPLEAAKSIFAKENISDKADFFLSDGLKNVPLEGVTDIVIAGMGGELISHIFVTDRFKCIGGLKCVVNSILALLIAVVQLNLVFHLFSYSPVNQKIRTIPVPTKAAATASTDAAEITAAVTFRRMLRI